MSLSSINNSIARLDEEAERCRRMGDTDEARARKVNAQNVSNAMQTNTTALNATGYPIAAPLATTVPLASAAPLATITPVQTEEAPTINLAVADWRPFLSTLEEAERERRLADRDESVRRRLNAMNISNDIRVNAPIIKARFRPSLWKKAVDSAVAAAPIVQDALASAGHYVQNTVAPAAGHAATEAGQYLQDTVLPVANAAATVAADKAGQYMQDTVIPAAGQAATGAGHYMQDTVLPAAGQAATNAGHYMQDTVIPAAGQAAANAGHYVQGTVIPAAGQAVANAGQAAANAGHYVQDTVNTATGMLSSAAYAMAALPMNFVHRAMNAISPAPVVPELNLSDIKLLEEDERLRRMHQDNTSNARPNANRVARLITFANGSRPLVLHKQGGFLKITKAAEERERVRRLANVSEANSHRQLASALSTVISSLGWPFISSAKHFALTPTSSLAEQERMRRLANPGDVFTARYNAQKVASLLSSALQGGDKGLSVKHTRALEEKERRHRMKSKTSVHNAHREAELIAGIGAPFFVPRELNQDAEILKKEYMPHRRASRSAAPPKAEIHKPKRVSQDLADEITSHPLLDTSLLAEEERKARIADKTLQQIAKANAGKTSGLIKKALAPYKAQKIQASKPLPVAEFAPLSAISPSTVQLAPQLPIAKSATKDLPLQENLIDIPVSAHSAQLLPEKAPLKTAAVQDFLPVVAAPRSHDNSSTIRPSLPHGSPSAPVRPVASSTPSLISVPLESLAPVYSAPAPILSAPAPILSAPAPILSAPAPILSAPAPVLSAPAPVLAAPAPTYTAPIRSAPAPLLSAPAPILSAPAPILSAPAPTYSAPAPTYTSAPTYSAPAPTYSAPIRSAPAPTYSAPAPTYTAPIRSAPAPTYSAPAPTYTAPIRSAPAPTYSAPAPTYSAPARTYSGLAPTYSAPAPGKSTPVYNNVPTYTDRSLHSTPSYTETFRPSALPTAYANKRAQSASMNQPLPQSTFNIINSSNKPLPDQRLLTNVQKMYENELQLADKERQKISRLQGKQGMFSAHKLKKSQANYDRHVQSARTHEQWLRNNSSQPSGMAAR